MRFKKGIELLLLLTTILVLSAASAEYQQQFVENVYEVLFEEQVLRQCG